MAPGVVKPCRGRTELFYGPANERKVERAAREAAAKAICAGCDVSEECLEVALDNREPDGIWGGLDLIERRALAKALRRRQHMPMVLV